MSAQAAVPAPRRNWWERNWKWFVPSGCLTLILLGCLFIGLIFTVVMGSGVSARLAPLNRAHRTGRV